MPQIFVFKSHGSKLKVQLSRRSLNTEILENRLSYNGNGDSNKDLRYEIIQQPVFGVINHMLRRILTEEKISGGINCFAMCNYQQDASNFDDVQTQFSAAKLYADDSFEACRLLSTQTISFHVERRCFLYPKNVLYK